MTGLIAGVLALTGVIVARARLDHVDIRPLRASIVAADDGDGRGLVETQRATGADEIVRILHAHPGERDAILAWLADHREGEVAEVTARLGQVERVLPAGVELQTVRGALTIPGGRRLLGDWKASVATTEPTQLAVEISPRGVRMRLSPALVVDTTWPLRDCTIRGASLAFADGALHADVEDVGGLDLAMFSIKDRVAGFVTGVLGSVLATSPLGRPGYQPALDPALDRTLDGVLRGVRAMFAHGHSPPVAIEELTQLSASASLIARRGAAFLADGNGLQIAPNSELTLSVAGAGTLRALGMASVGSLGLEASGLDVIARGKPIARLESLAMAPGGAITIDRMTLLGKAESAQLLESELSLIVGMVAGSGDSCANGLAHNAERPQLVDGVTRALIEKTFSETIHSLVGRYRWAIRDVDLARALHIDGTAPPRDDPR